MFVLIKSEKGHSKPLQVMGGLAQAFRDDVKNLRKSALSVSSAFRNTFHTNSPRGGLLFKPFSTRDSHQFLIFDFFRNFVITIFVIFNS